MQLLIHFLFLFGYTDIYSFSYSLFHVVVANDDISTKIIGHLNAQKGGRVTFVPLNRVKAPQATYPQSSDVIPLLKKLKFLEKYRSAFGQVGLIKCLLLAQ